MDSGSYSNVRKGAMPPSSGSVLAATCCLLFLAAVNVAALKDNNLIVMADYGNMVAYSAPNSNYKANVNRTKTRKWVEAKVQSYDGDDWGNDYDDYDDGNDYDEPEPEPMPPPAAKPNGPRGPAGFSLPSSRTFSQPGTASLPSNTNPRVYGSSALRDPRGLPSLNVQTQQGSPAATSPPYVTESAHPNASSSQANMFGPQSAAPVSTQSQFPPRKSSMGHQDQPLVDDPTGPAPAPKRLSLVKPSDIYRRMSEDKEKERLSMDSGRPSLDSLPNRAEGTTSPAQFRSSAEQRRRTSFESHDGSESARVPISTLAPVVERGSEYGMDGFPARAPDEQSPVLPEPALASPRIVHPQNELSDDVKSEAMKSRRYSTSPQLPSLPRVSDFGFGDDFFSGSGDLNSQTGPRSETPLSTSNGKSAATQGETVGATQPRPSSTRPQIPGGWVSESLTVRSEQPTPLEQPDATDSSRLTNLQGVAVTPIAEDVAGPDSPYPITNVASLPSTANTPQYSLDNHTAKGLGGPEPTSAAEQPDYGIPSKLSGAGKYPASTAFLPPLRTGNSPDQPRSRPTSTILPTTGNRSPQKSASSMARPTSTIATSSGFSPTAPLNPNRSQAGQPDIVLPPSQLRNSTMSTIDTTSPEKESDILREEIIKSLSPAPISPGSSSVPARGDLSADHTPGNLTGDSTYLSGVYDDYLALGEEKSLREVSQAAKSTPTMVSSRSPEEEYGAVPESREKSVTQPAPLNPAKSPTPDSQTRPRRFSWQQGEEEVAMSSAEPKPTILMLPQEPEENGLGSLNAESTSKLTAISPVSDTLQAGTRANGTISHQVSDVSSRGPEDASLAAIESPSPVSFVGTKALKPASDERNGSRLSLAEEKEQEMIGDAQSAAKSSVSDQHPALSTGPEQDEDEASPLGAAADLAPVSSQPTPTAFREILNLNTYDQRVQKFEETREQFYVLESGLSNWLNQLQSQPEHAEVTSSFNGAVAAYNASALLSKSGAPAAGAPGVSPLLSKTSAAAHPRRSSIGNMQQLMGGSSVNFGASGAQVGTKSKELFQAAGAFGNKGMKSGMKLFNKGKNKLRERAAGDKGLR